MSNTKLDCKDCYYGRHGGCSCEREMAAGCIPSPISKEEKEKLLKEELPKRLALFTICEECGKKLGNFYILPLGFRVICQKCYEDFKHRRQPNQMHYIKKSDLK